MAKSLVITYILWLVGGWLGLHHLYLGRDRHALVWMFTLGGCFGLGWIRDIVCIPDYVHDANNVPSYIAELKHRAKLDSAPSFHTLRFIGELVVGMLFGVVVRSAIPEPVIEGHRYLDLFVPLAVAIGVWLVGGIGHERISLKYATLGSIAGVPIFLRDPSNLTYMALFSAILGNYWGKSWRLERPRKNLCGRLSVISVCVLLYTSLWTSAIYHNSYVTTADGERVKVSDALHHFYHSPAWEETKDTLWSLWKELLENGPGGFHQEFVSSLDPEGEAYSHKVLGLPYGASEKEITSTYRQLVREWHPDKHTDKEMKKEAAEKFIQIQRAYETLSQIKTRRAARNTKQRRPDDEL